MGQMRSGSALAKLSKSSIACIAAALALIALQPHVVDAGTPGRKEALRTPTSLGQLTAALALHPSAEAVLQVSQWAYLLLRSYRCHIHEVDLVDGKNNGQSSADIAYSPPDRMRVDATEIEHPPMSSSPSRYIYLNDGAHSQQLWLGSWGHVKNLVATAGSMPEAGGDVARLLVNNYWGDIFNIAAASGPKLSSTVINGAPCWQIVTTASLDQITGGAVSKATGKLIAASANTTTIDIDKKTLLLTRYVTDFTLRGSRFHSEQTVTSSGTNVPVSPELFTDRTTRIVVSR